jgi:hypothetical protein
MLKKNISPKPNNIFKTILIIILLTILVIISLEIVIRIKFDSYSKGTCSTIKLSQDSFLNIPQSNCKIIVKHWENNKEIIYKTNEQGNRVSTIPVNFSNDSIPIAFFGDSFTWGDMNDVYENYTHYAISELDNINVNYSNFGVPGYNSLEVFERMKLSNYKNYDYIIYGLTPNDLFAPQDEAINKEKKISGKVKEKFILNIIKEKIRRHNLRSIKVAGKVLFDLVPGIYINLYTARDPNLSGYLSSSSSSYWDDRYLEFFDLLKNLNPLIKEKLIIQIIPQRVQVLLYQKGDLNNALAFENRIISMCNKLDFKCNGSQLQKLSSLKNTHYTIDGHFTSSANKMLGKELSRFISNIIDIN